MSQNIRDKIIHALEVMGVKSQSRFPRSVSRN
jgi:hypothetical protein